MIRVFTFCLMMASLAAQSQSITQAQSIVLNDIVQYANQSSGEVKGVFHKIVSYYPRVKYYQQKKGAPVPPYDCQSIPDEYYFNHAVAGMKTMANPALTARLNALHVAAGLVDSKCKEIDTYHKLQDYKRDNFQQVDILIKEIQAAIIDYKKQQAALATALESAYRKMQASIPGNPYHITTAMMSKEIAHETAFLDLWTFNLNEDIHTGWPVDQLKTSIQETDQALANFSQRKLALEYPANSMYGAFQEMLGSVLTSKRSGLDGYNAEAKQSDRHSNEVYLDLINYVNGGLVADKNTFLRFATANGFYGLGSIEYVPVFDIRTAAVKEINVVKPFQDIPHVAVNMSATATPIPPEVANTLDNYVEFINETVRQLDFLIRGMNNFNSDASYYKGLKSFKGKGGMTYDHKDFQIPTSLYQSAVGRTTTQSPAYRKSLNDQATVLINILTEMDQLSIALGEECDQKNYEKDDFKKVYQIMERYAVLFEIADAKKEQLYLDVRAVADSYPLTLPTGSWAVSYKALRQLFEEDKSQLFKVKKFLRGDTSSAPSSAAIDKMVREVISKEYANMKGIEQYGRSNGLCPYSPYEDVPANSRTFSDDIQKIRTKKGSQSYEGPYHDYIYIFNVIVDDYNKFCELAKIRLLKTIHEPSYYQVEYPKPKPAEQEFPQRENPSSVIQTRLPSNGSFKDDDDVSGNATVTGRVIHDTIKVTDIIRIETRRQDTVYIEKHDTIYKDSPNDKLLSMDGYAANNLVFLLDVSGSMNAGQKLPLLKKSMLLLLKILRKEDNVSIVVYSGKARTVLPPTSAKEQDKIKKVIESLRSDGATDGNAGIKMAYKVADGNYIRGGNNRIVLATDGEFAVSDETNALITKFSSADVFLTVFNFGANATAAKSLQKLSGLGKGNYENITRENSDFKLIREAKGKKAN